MNQHLISTRAKPATCPNCGKQLLVALDEGLPAHVDLTPIDPAKEIIILLTGTWTYTLTPGKQLIHRTPERITSRRFHHLPVHAQHQCHTPTLV